MNLQVVEQGPKKHNVDVTGGQIFTHLRRGVVDIDNSHEADLIENDLLTVLGPASTIFDITLPSDDILPGAEL